MRLSLVLLPLALFALCPRTKAGGTPPPQPILRIEAGFHGASLTSAAASADGSVMISASLDKTLRVWSFEAGQLVLEETLRPPIGASDEGKLYACAISPDGESLAVAGWTGFEWDESNSIYLIERATGRMRARIKRLPNVVNHLCFSPDGQHLLACLGGTWGVRCYSLEGEQEWEDWRYLDGSFGACWLSDGCCVATSLDGHLRLYGPDGTRRAKVETTAGARPLSVAFDGRDEILVGYDDGARLDRFGALELEPRGSLEHEHPEATFQSVTSQAGRWWAGGGEPTSGASPVLSWGSAGGAPRTYPGTSSLVIALQPVGTSRLLVAERGPALQLWNLRGEPLAALQSVACDMRGKQFEHFRASPDGRRLWFGRDALSASAVLFDLGTASYAPSTEAPQELLPQRLDASGIRLDGWDAAGDLRIDEHPVLLAFNERPRALVVAPHEPIVVLGADFSLRALTRDGEELWRRAVPETCWGLLTSADGQLIIAAYGDGTIRWHRLEDGQELLALFPHRDGERWVAWTPSGYYDCSVGGEELIGWHVNRGADQLADFYPASRFREQFYRPALVAAVLETRDEALALERSGGGAASVQLASLPPVVRILGPRAGERLPLGTRTVSYSLRSSEPVSDVRLLLNGVECARARGLELVGKDSLLRRESEIELSAELAGQTVNLSILAYNRYGASEAAVVRFDIERATQPLAEDPLTKPKAYVLAIGVSDYELEGLDLGLAAKDARDLAAAFRAQAGRLFRSVDVRLLEDARAQDVMLGLEWLETECTARDLAVLFLAGHGVTDNRDRYFFLPADANPEKLRSSSILYTDIVQTIEALPGKTVAFIDTCHAGNITGAAHRRSPSSAASMTRVINELSSAENGSVVFAAATGHQYGLEKEEWGNGAFTKALVEALSGAAPADLEDEILRAILGRPTLTINLLNAYVAERVKQLTGGLQTPTMERPATVPDFPIALR